MKKGKVLFLGGDPTIYASVQIRCVDVANTLGLDYALRINDLRQIPQSYTKFVCIKPNLTRNQLIDLSKRGSVVWDIIDSIPPKNGIDVYLASTRTVQAGMRHYGRVEHIPHHHCNFTAQPNAVTTRRPGWIGTREWCPKLRGLKAFKFFVQGKTQAEVVAAYRRIGVGLNLRAEHPWHNSQHPEKLNLDFHIALNSGIKLINCIGFGIPSVSSEEPAFKEIDEDFTIFTSLRDCRHHVRELQSNDRLLRRLRRNCLRKAPDFHLENIARRYQKLLRSL